MRAYDSPGWVAGDFHIHAAPSTDSGLPIDKRVFSCAAEGLEVAVATDHNYVTDYAPVIASSVGALYMAASRPMPASR